MCSVLLIKYEKIGEKRVLLVVLFASINTCLLGFLFFFICLFRFKSIIFRLSFNLLIRINAMDQILFWLVPAASIMALCFAWYFHRQMMKRE